MSMTPDRPTRRRRPARAVAPVLAGLLALVALAAPRAADLPWTATAIDDDDYYAPRDRPYAGWLYGGVGLMQDTNSVQFDRVALRLGTIGASSGAGQLQTKWHLLIQVSQPQGWRAQLHDEPTLDLFRERKWRIHRAV